MRWDRLFDDLEAQLEEEQARELAGEVSDRTRREIARLRAGDRIREAAGSRLQVTVAGAGHYDGTVSRVGPDWFLLDVAAQPAALVRLGGVLGFTGLTTQAVEPGAEGKVLARLTFGYALRGVARDRSACRLHLVDGSVIDGTIDRVGADFVDVAEHPAGEPRRAASVAAVRTVMHDAIAVIRLG